ncbi:MAG: hypothetical protein D6702_12515 [Planctomycetota bacterium]|nr:MAG: hypothetical protein D6702_12515 [Planctomycetota bacterium]
MIDALVFLVHAASLAALLGGLIDAGALAFGGTSLAAVGAAGAVLTAFGLRLVEPDSPWLRNRLLRPPDWMGPRTAILFLALAGLLLPGIASWGGGRGPAGAVIVLLLLLQGPLGALAAATGAALAGGGPGRREVVLFGSVLGGAAITAFGLGPSGWLVVCLLAWLTAPEQEAEAEAQAGADDLPRPAGGGPVLVVAGFVLACVFFLLFPLTELFDGSSSTQDLRRLLALGLPAALAGLAFGGLAGGRWRLPVLAAAAAGLVAAGALGSAAVARMADPRVFSGLLEHPLVRRFAADATRLTEDDFLYVPWLALHTAGLAAVCAGILLRLAIGGRGRVGLGPVLAGAGLAAILPALADGGGRQAPFPLPPPLSPPPSSAPFFDNFEYPLAAIDGAPADRVTPVARLRLLERRGVGQDSGPTIPADGRNFLRAEFDQRSPRRDEARLAARLTPARGRVMLVGPPHAGTLSTWRELGFAERVVACDPPTLAELALTGDAALRATGFERLVETPAATEGPFDLILIRDEALWQRRRNPLRSSLLAAAARRLGPSGRLAIGLDPARVTLKTLGGTARALARRLEHVELWLVPQEWRRPRLLLVGWNLDAPLADPPSPLLRVAADQALRSLPAVSLSGPLAPVVQDLAGTEYRRPDRGRSTARAAELLVGLNERLGPEAADSLLPFAAAHLSAQVYDVRDDLEQTPDHDRIELTETPLIRLADLTRAHPEDPFLPDFWRRLAPLVVAKKVPDWAQRWYGMITDELGWDDPDLLFVVGQSWLEMLMPEQAREVAERILVRAPRHRNGRILLARSLAALERHQEALAAFAAAADDGDLPVLAEVAWAEEALAAGEEDLARDLAERVRSRQGEAVLSRPLRRLLGLGEPDQVHLLPGMADGD